MKHEPVAIFAAAIAGGGKGTTEDGLKARGIPFKTLPFRAKFDREVDEKTPLGLQIQKYRSVGQLVPNELVLPLVDEAFEDVGSTNLLFLDGFPRNLQQADFALERVRHHGFKRIIVFHIDTPVSTCLRRLKKRGRDAVDVDPVKIAQRVDEYDEQTVPMVRHFRKNVKALGIEFYMVDGENLIDNMDAYLRMLNIDWMKST